MLVAVAQIEPALGENERSPDVKGKAPPVAAADGERARRATV